MSSNNSPLAGVKVMLLGDAGTGKTYSLKTLADAGIEVCILATENGWDVVLGSTDDSRFRVVKVKPTYGNLTQLMEGAQAVAGLTNEQLLKKIDMTRMANSPYMAILSKLMKFVDDRTGEDLGNVGTWGTDRALVIDSFSGLCNAIISNTIGTKPTMSQGEYQIAQIAAKNLIMQACNDFRCHFVLICHAEREIDPIGGGIKVMAQGIGQKLSPQLPKDFSDVIMTKRQNTKFFWDTADSQAMLKTRNLAIAPELPPDFRPIIASWQKRGGIIETAP